METNVNGWNEYRRLVLSELERQNSNLSDLSDKLDTRTADLKRCNTEENAKLRKEISEMSKEFAKEVATIRADFAVMLAAKEKVESDFRTKTASDISALNVKAGMWGGIVGGCTGIITILVIVAMNFIK